MGLGVGARGDRRINGRGVAVENLEQHAQRDEPRTAPAAFDESANGRAVAPNQPAFSL